MNPSIPTGTATETRPPSSAAPRRARRALLFALVALVASLALASLAPAFQTPPEKPVFAKPELSREWRGHLPDLNVDSMFRRDMPRQGSFQDAFRTPR
jgi:hypothetical protein